MTRFALDMRSLPPTEGVSLAAGLGLTAIQIPWLGGRGQWREAVMTSGLQVALLELGGRELGDQGDPLAWLLVAIREAAELGCRKVSVTAPHITSDEGAERDSVLTSFCKVVGDVAQPAEKAGVRICIRGDHGDAPGDMGAVANTVELADVLGRINRANVSVDLDAAELVRAGEDPLKAVAQFAGRIGHARIGRPGQVPTELGARFLHDLNTFGYGDAVSIGSTEDGSLTKEVGASVLRSFLDLMGGDVSRDVDRLRRVHAAMSEAELDLLVCAASENVLALTGYWPMNGTCVAVVPAAGEPYLYVPAGEETWAARSGWPNIVVYQAGRIDDPPFDESMQGLLRDFVRRSHDGFRTVGVEGALRSLVPPHMAHEASGRHEQLRESVTAIMAGSHIRCADPVLLKAKAIKTEREIRAIRRVSAIADVGLATFRDGLAAGVRDIDLATDVERAIERFGVGFETVTRVRGYAYVMSGAQTSQCHLDYEFSSPRVMAEGEIVLMELAVVADGYWNDLSRVYVVGEPTGEQVRLFEIAERAFQSARLTAVPGRTGADVDAAARDVIAEAGLGTAYPHQTGHGVGMAFHEPYPLLKPASEDVLEPGMVVAIEPGVYIPGVGGVRNEDDCLVGSPEGASSLQVTPHSSSSRTLASVA